MEERPIAEDDHFADEAVVRIADNLSGWRPRHAGAPATHQADRAGGTKP